ncbi:MAG: hypothetical protein H5T62_12900 [Anaerolineae bacterium]|nr:hypothetical protein [Anaerolineae bacterium]
MLKLIRTTILMLSLLTLSLGATACCQITGGEPTIERAVTCQDVTENYEPINETTTYAPGDTFYCSVKVSNLQKDQVVTWKWYFGDEFLYEQPLVLEKSGSGYIAAYLTNDQLWPTGDYKVEVYLDGTLTKTVNFSVQ